MVELDLADHLRVFTYGYEVPNLRACSDFGW